MYNYIYIVYAVLIFPYRYIYIYYIYILQLHIYIIYILYIHYINRIYTIGCSCFLCQIGLGADWAPLNLDGATWWYPMPPRLAEAADGRNGSQWHDWTWANTQILPNLYGIYMNLSDVHGWCWHMLTVNGIYNMNWYESISSMPWCDLFSAQDGCDV